MSVDTKGATTYSGVVNGDAQNHKLPVRFDVTDGYVGISQYDGTLVADRVLLSPKQVQALVQFMRKAKR